MLRKVAILFFFVLIADLVVAQPYQNALGVRLGFGLGLSYKSFVSGNAAIEGIASYQYVEHGYGLCGLYEIHNYRTIRTSNMALVYGLGAHVAYYVQGWYKNRKEILYEEAEFNFGVDGIFGIDYYVPEASIDWGIDIKPMFDFIHAGFRFWDASISIRYTF